MKNTSLSIGLSLIAIIISIIAICVTLPRNENIGFDYIGVIVGILALLVTVLIAWQIYTLFDIRKTKDDIDYIRDKIAIQSEKNSLITSMALSDFYYNQLMGSHPLGYESQYIYYRVSLLFHASQIDDIKTCDVIVDVLNTGIAKPEEINFDNRNVLSLLSKVKNPERIKGFPELLGKIGRIQHK